ncbi:uncharacterized protein METZ01_LOCUS38548 [marine metagenome]|jgi:ABC-type transport system involved in cytochrome c biogenesis permease component|uniref:Uncharacterized protein n=1 Tax=marine metagenome TaxID=408172 RepID=A0A381R396_9ZZZZ
MFSNGQIVFGVLFFITFLIIITYSYKKDLKKLKGAYKGIRWVILGFIAFISILVFLKKLSIS